jgi:hypothetical protein
MSRICVALAMLLALLAPAGAQSIRSTYRSAPTLVGLPGRTSTVRIEPVVP